jgi:hypothetical protein
MIASALTAAFILGPHSGLLSFLCTHNLDRDKAAPGVDLKDGSDFTELLILYIFLGFTSYIFQNYLLWLLATFTNNLTVLSRYSGYVEALKALGLITAFAIDSNRTPFLTEEASYFLDECGWYDSLHYLCNFVHQGHKIWRRRVCYYSERI